MVSMDKVKRGIARYLDQEFTAKMNGWQKWVFGTVSAMYIENSAQVIQKVQNHPAAKALNLFDESGNVAVDRVYQHLRMQAQKGPITVEIPLIGAVTLNESDVEKLYNCIMQA